MEDETRSFVESVKGGLFDSLLNSIDDKFCLTDQAFILPKELIPYLEGKREPKTKQEAEEWLGLFGRWTDAVLRILKKQPTNESLRKFLEALPEPFKGDLMKALKRQLQTEGT